MYITTTHFLYISETDTYSLYKNTTKLETHLQYTHIFNNEKYHSLTVKKKEKKRAM